MVDAAQDLLPIHPANAERDIDGPQENHQSSHLSPKAEGMNTPALKWCTCRAVHGAADEQLNRHCGLSDKLSLQSTCARCDRDARFKQRWWLECIVV